MNIKLVTGPLRHTVAKTIMQILTPKLWESTKKTVLFNEVPRPFTLFLKQQFGDQELTGCEIGFGQGINARNLLKELNLETLYCIEPFKPYMGARGKMLNISEDRRIYHKLVKDKRVHFIRSTSDVAFRFNLVPEGLDFVYIDGLHTSEQCLRDILNSLEVVRHGGYVGGHDFSQMWENLVMDAVFHAILITGLIPNVTQPDFWFKKIEGVKT